jgi:hypothetical protein
MQFINTAVIILLVNFNVKIPDSLKNDGLLFGIIPIFDGKYDDFSVMWYFNVGVTLCTT